MALKYSVSFLNRSALRSCTKESFALVFSGAQAKDRPTRKDVKGLLSDDSVRWPEAWLCRVQDLLSAQLKGVEFIVRIPHLHQIEVTVSMQAPSGRAVAGGGA